jgi:NTE family protein
MTITPAPAGTLTHEPVIEPAVRGTALCLSGGGYRAMLFHLGTLWYLNEHGWLPKLDRISSVSGGSITSATLGLHWSKLAFNAAGVATNFSDEVITPVRRLASKTIDIPSILAGVFLPGSASDRISAAYQKHLYGAARLQDLPDRPRFVINATNVMSGVLVRFSKPYIWDYRVGKIPNPTRLLAEAVTASSAFPPVLSPVTIDVSKETFTPNTGDDLQRPPFTTRIVATDGGVYDNLGLETAWKSFSCILVSDAGGKMQPDPDPKHDWARHALRINDLIDNQVRSLRQRDLITAFTNKEKEGAYWGIRTDITNYHVPTVLPCPHDKTLALAATPTRLAAVPDLVQERLINWGYAVTDAAMRAHVDPALPALAAFPYAAAGVG